MELTMILPDLSQIPALAGLRAGNGDLIEMTQILFFLVLIVACGSLVVRLTGRSLDPRARS